MNLKSTFFVCCLCLMATMSFGQTKTANLEPSKVVRNTFTIPAPLSQARFIAMDTLFPTIVETQDCSQNVFDFRINDGWGFVGGMNFYGDLEKAQFFNYENGDNNYLVQEAFIFIGSANVVGDGEVVVKIYETAGADTGPGTLVGTSEPVQVSDLGVDDEFAIPTQFIFSTPAQVTTNGFFVSLDISNLYSSQDTVSVLMTGSDCGIADESWELFEENGALVWASMFDTWSSLSANFFMAAIVESDALSATKELVAGSQRISLHDAFPNPANGQLTIAYDLEKSAAIQIEIYSLTGQLIQQIDKSTLPAGQYQEQISTSNLDAGTYFYGIRTASGKLMNKFSVGK